MLSQKAAKLSERIKKAIEEDSISACSYEELMSMADEDGFLDNQEKNLLRELHHLVDNGTIKWVPCDVNQL